MIYCKVTVTVHLIRDVCRIWLLQNAWMEVTVGYEPVKRCFQRLR